MAEPTNNNAVSSQVTDSITQNNVSVVGESPSQALGMIYQTMSHSMSLSMQNAVTTQNGLQQVATSIVSTACANIVAAGK